MIYRQIFLSGAIVLGLNAPEAQAQDRWAGLYGGVALSAHEATTKIPGSGVHNYKEESATLGFYGGYTFVRDSGFAWGPDVLLTGISSSGGATDAAVGATSFEGSFLLSPRIRLGYATDKVFFYGHLGLGLTDLGIDGVGDSDNLTLGGAAGIGMEYATGDLWSVRVEATTYGLDVDDRNINGTLFDLDSGVQQFTLGLSRKF